MQSSLSQPLSNVQLELLKVFSHQLSDKDLHDLRLTLARFFAERLIAKADNTWDEEGWNEEKVQELLSTKLRASTHG